MANQLQLNGAQVSKPVKLGILYTGRIFSGIWTNRSPLRDAGSTRIEEKFYGARGDAMIDGLNTEVTNRLTLARRPGNSVFDSNTFNNVDSIQSFRMFGTNSEKIDVMVDQSNALYSLYNGTKNLVWTKSAGAGQSYMQSVGNTLYFGNGVDNKKWLQSLTEWSSGASWNGPTTPFMTTFLIDHNGNIQQLTSTIIPISTTQVATNVLTVTTSSSTDLTTVLSTDLEVTFPGAMAATVLQNQTVTITGVTTNTFTAAFTTANYGPTSETGKVATVVAGGTPVSSSTEPTWSTVPLTPGMATPSNALTNDNTAQWTNRGLPIENWGIVAPSKAPIVTVGLSRVAWHTATYYSLAGVIVDPNGNLQQVSTAGKSGSGAPSWGITVGSTTTDGTVVWTCIQLAASLVWQPHTHYTPGTFLIGNASGTNCLFQLADISTPYLTSNATCYTYLSTTSGAFNLGWGGSVGNPVLMFSGNVPAPGFPNSTFSAQSLVWNPTDPNTNMFVQTLNGAGQITGSTDTGFHANWETCIVGQLHVRVPGQYSFNLSHDDGAYIGFGDGAIKISGTFTNIFSTGNLTGYAGYPIFSGNNNSSASAPAYWQDTFVVNFPTAGDYHYEIDYTNWRDNSIMTLTCNGHNICPTGDESGGTEPIWPSWSTTFAPNYPNVTEAAGQYKWNNLGPTADFSWQPNMNFTLPDTTIIDANGNQQAPYRTGYSGSLQPTFATGVNQLTNDNPNLIWINQGAAAAPAPGTVSTFNGGWQYAIALVNTLDDTVSNCGTLSVATGNFIGAEGVILTPGSGLPDPSKIDPQADYVAVFRTTDGNSVPFLIPGKGNSIYTVSLSDYLANGYTDNTLDTELNNLLEGAINGENTPPLAGAINLTYHLNRIFFSIGNVVYWTSGPDTPIGNGVNGVSPLNFDAFPSLVKRIVPTILGALVFTVSDIYLIPGQGTTNNPIQTGVPYAQGIGLLSYNALDINGTIIGFFTTDSQFIIFDPSAGISHVGTPIADQFRQNTGKPGTSWNPSTVYVAWHTSGEDQAWYVADSVNGWYRLMTTPAPETGLTWSPFANITGGCKSVTSVEVSPGVHKLLLGPAGNGNILKRDLSSFTDNGASYHAYSTIGSIVLAQPSQVANVTFITTDSVRIGTPLTLQVLIDEAFPYYTQPFESIDVWESDPPNIPESRSILGQRFYLSDMLEQGGALCRHMQLKIVWSSVDTVQNELQALTIVGTFAQEG